MHIDNADLVRIMMLAKEREHQEQLAHMAGLRDMHRRASARSGRILAVKRMIGRCLPWR